MSDAERERLVLQTRYRGSGLHKRIPDEYPFDEPCTPRQNKTLCDQLRPIDFREARDLFVEGIRRGMVSRMSIDGFPVFVWAVDGHGEAYEAKPGEIPVCFTDIPWVPAMGCSPTLVRREWRKRAKP